MKTLSFDDGGRVSVSVTDIVSSPKVRSQVRAVQEMVYVCPEKDIVCGNRPENWCGDCPLRRAAILARERGM